MLLDPLPEISHMWEDLALDLFGHSYNDIFQFSGLHNIIYYVPKFDSLLPSLPLLNAGSYMEHEICWKGFGK